MSTRSSSRSVTLLLAFAALSLVTACAGRDNSVPTGIAEPDRFLFERGSESLTEKRWFTAREYYRRILDGYPQSQYRDEAKLGVADSYLGEGTIESLLLAANEYREFLTFYPTSPRADYAQYKLGMVHFQQMRGPQRDQTETRAAVREFQTFMERYPNSQHREEVAAKLREARDRLSTSEYQVGYFYFRQGWNPGAIDRFRSILKSDPGFTYRDAVYFHLAEALLKLKLDAEALPLYEKLLAEFEQSDYLKDSRERVAQLRAALEKSGAQPPTADGQATDGAATAGNASSQGTGTSTSRPD